MNTVYQPINCGFHDILLDRIVRKKLVFIKYRTTKGIQKKKLVLNAIFSENKEEFLVMEDQETIRLDTIISIDGIQSS